jgi:hypothetical protein
LRAGAANRATNEWLGPSSASPASGRWSKILRKWPSVSRSLREPEIGPSHFAEVFVPPIRADRSTIGSAQLAREGEPIRGAMARREIHR